MSGAAGPGPGPPAGQGRSPLPCAPRPAAALQLAGGAEPARPGVAVIDLRFPRGAAADVSAAPGRAGPGGAGGGTGAGDRLQELLHGLPERAGAAPRPQRLPPVGDLPAGLLPDALPAHRGGLPGLLLPPPPPDAVRRGPGDSGAVHPAAAVPGLAPLHHRGAADFPSRTEEPPEGFPLLALPVDSSGAASQPTRGAP